MSQTGESKSQLTTTGQTFEHGFENDTQCKSAANLLQNKTEGTSKAVYDSVSAEEMKLTPELAKKRSLIESSGQPHEIVIGLCSLGRLGTTPDMLKYASRPCTPAAELSVKHLGVDGKRNSLSLKEMYPLRASASANRIIRSRPEEKNEEPKSSNNLADVSSGPVVRQGRQKAGRKKKGEERKDNEYSRIRTNLRYFLNRINYERSLIDAYSSEGWKGLSLEKLKPEKELERAMKEILRRKLKIRDLFQRLDLLSAEGRLPASLFDSEGEIASEDIFCAKCRSKDLSADNDIILCDGVCDRGFHQYCLVPPLLKEDIPPDNEGWLCPGCDCKVDCIDLLNQSLGTKLSITDSWEKVFPEAVAGEDQDPNFGLPSDDSDDDNYDPDGPETDEQDQEDENSDESDFTSASEKLEAPPKDDPYMGLPSDDSEDDDFDPNALDRDDDTKQETSSSDFTSDSEDLGAALEENGTSPKSYSGRKSRLHVSKKQSGNNELETDLGRECSPAVPERRGIERLDYRRLYDETYGNVPSSSSDDEDYLGDEDYTDVDAVRPRRKATRERSFISSRNSTGSESERNTDSERRSPEANKRTATKKSNQKSKGQDKSTSLSKSGEWSAKICSSGERSGSSANRLGQAVTQRLHKAFQENQYPDKATKESLARELEITFRQVDNWFRNMRWSVNHSSSNNGTLVKTISSKDVRKPENETANSGCGEDGKETEPVTCESSAQKSITPKSRKRKRR